jgi:uncharacterized protein (TIGR03437 family)
MIFVNRIITVFALGASAALSWGQTTVSLDTSGNGRLNGTYYFRQLSVVNFDSNGNVTEMAATYGKIVFDGKGGYVLTGQKVDNAVSGGQPQPLSVTASYGIGANALGSLDNPLAPTDTNSWVYGSVGQGGVFVGSSTEGYYDDTFIAIPAPASNATNASFNGNYWLGVLDFPGANETSIKNALFKLAPNGQGAFGSLSIAGQAANQTAASITQSVTGATYAFQSDGSATLTVPAPSGVTAANALFSGTKTMYLSGDGNFIVGGTTNGFDIFFGVRAFSGTATNATYKSLYFLSGLEDAVQTNGVDSFYGSVSSNGAGIQIIHERLTAPYYPYAIDFGSDDDASVNTDGTFSDSYGYSYGFGVNGTSAVAVGTGGVFSLIAALQAPTLTGTGVFLNPLYITNAFSFSPTTASWAPGELITLYGTNLTPVTLTTQGGVTFPTILGGVQVLINGVAAPIYRVVQGQGGGLDQISAVIPYSMDPTASTPVAVAQFQVVNSGTKSNTVTWFLNDNAPGIAATGGVGTAASLRYDSAGNASIISASNPAKRGDTISLFLTGMGAVTPKITDGAIGPTSPLSQANAFTNMYLAVYFNDFNSGVSTQATVTFAGLAPGLAGLYQMNVQVPTTVGPGNVYIEVVTDSADNVQVYIPVVTQ